MEGNFRDYDIEHQKCPVCNNDHPVGKLSGGQAPKFYCRNCGEEFKVEKTNKGIIATVKLFTVSGVKAGTKTYLYDEKTKSFKNIANKKV